MIEEMVAYLKARPLRAALLRVKVDEDENGTNQGKAHHAKREGHQQVGIAFWNGDINRPLHQLLGNQAGKVVQEAEQGPQQK